MQLGVSTAQAEGYKTQKTDENANNVSIKEKIANKKDSLAPLRANINGINLDADQIQSKLKAAMSQQGKSIHTIGDEITKSDLINQIKVTEMSIDDLKNILKKSLVAESGVMHLFSGSGNALQSAAAPAGSKAPLLSHSAAAAIVAVPNKAKPGTYNLIMTAAQFNAMPNPGSTHMINGAPVIIGGYHIIQNANAFAVVMEEHYEKHLGLHFTGSKIQQQKEVDKREGNKENEGPKEIHHAFHKTDDADTIKEVLNERNKLDKEKERNKQINGAIWENVEERQEFYQELNNQDEENRNLHKDARIEDAKAKERQKDIER